MSGRSFGTIRKLGSGGHQVRYRNSAGRMVSGPGTFATKAEGSQTSPKSVRTTSVRSRQSLAPPSTATCSPVRARTLGLVPVQRPARPTLTADELLRLADAVPPRYRARVLLAGTVGLRWGEAIGLLVSVSTSSGAGSASVRRSKR